MKKLIACILSFLSAAALSRAVDLHEAVSVTATGALWADGWLWVAYSCKDESGSGTLHVSRTSDMAHTWEDVFSSDDYSIGVPATGSSGTVTVYCSSNEGVFRISWTGSGWTQPSFVCSGKCFNPPVETGSGALVLPVGGDDSSVFACISGDDGISWTGGEPFKVENLLPANPRPAFIAEGESLRAFLLSNGKAVGYECGSEDAGLSWSGQKVFLPLPETGFSINRLPSGRLLLVKNGRLDESLYVFPDGLYAYLSDDDGQTWYGGLVLDYRPFSQEPRVAVSPGGRIAVLFSNNFRASAQVCIAMTTEKEIDSASGFFTKRARIVQPVLLAEQGPVRYRRMLSAINTPRKNYARQTLRIATYNIQYPAPGTPAWSERLKTLKAVFNTYDFDVIGSQEPFKQQLDDLMEVLGGKYSFVSVNRHLDSTNTASAYNPVFYKKSRVELLDWGTFWYAAAPALKSWGANSPRFCTWAEFRDRRTGKVFFCFNSHFDHIGLEIRAYSAFILASRAAEIAGGLPAVFTGDFNSDETTRCYREITQCGFISDSMNAVDNPVGREYRSITNYKPADEVKKDGRHIDHIFYTPANSKVVYWELVTDSFGGPAGSDHLPVYIDWKIAD